MPPVGPSVLAVFGPTGSGKSAVAEELARRLAGEVVSADSMQVYRGLPILTNQPTSPTRLVGVWSLRTEGSVGRYARLAHETIDEILASGSPPVVAGGTGLYLRAALAELDVPPPPEPGARKHLDRLYDRLGAERAHGLLLERDPAAAARVHPNDRRRVVRGLELLEAGSSLRPDDDQLWGERTRHPTVVVGLELPRDVLAARIEARTRAMFARGVEDEVTRALEEPVSATARRIIGLREVAKLPREQAIDAIIARTRRYAAYQRKWMRRIPALVPLNGDRSPAAIADEVVTILRQRSSDGR